MDLRELESFKLSDAVKFHDKLNPTLWTEKHKLDPEVQDQLMEIARDFISELGLGSLKVEDITISGSNAAYSYTPHSDLDLHILVDFSKLSNDEIYRELFNAKKTVYNDSHDIKVHGVPVELYVQDKDQPHVSLGEYSILKKEWIKIPKKRRANFDQIATKLKYEKLGELIELAMKTRDVKRVDKVLDTIKRYRKAGLDKHGEFGPENLAYKALRTTGLIQKLFDLKNALHSHELSLKERMNLDVKTLSPEHVAKKHGVSVEHINKQLVLGIKVEKEHTTDTATAKEIALDHLGEDPNYYTKLKKAELEETMDNPYPFRLMKHKYGYSTSVKLPDGTYLEIMFNMMDDDPNQYHVEFTRNRSWNITGLGDAQRVLATVISAIFRFLSKHKPYLLTFSASKQPLSGTSTSRAKLYTRMVNRYADKYGYEVYIEDQGDEVVFELTRDALAVFDDDPLDAYIPDEDTKKKDIAEADFDVVSPTFIENYIAKIHKGHTKPDDEELLQWIHSFDNFKLETVNLDKINLKYSGLSSDKVEKYHSQTNPPAIVIDGTNNWIIDGYHRANAAKQRGDKTIKAYVGRQDLDESTSGTVPASEVYNLVQSLHRRYEDFSEGDLTDRIYWFDDYKLENIPVSKLDTTEWEIDDDLVQEYVDQIKKTKKHAPPIVYDPVANSIIDGTHRANAYEKLGIKTIPAYVGNTQSDDYGNRSEYDDEIDESSSGSTSLPQNITNEFLNSISSTEKTYYKKRDNCGPAALHMQQWLLDNKKISTKRVRGNFIADDIVYDKDDFTLEMRKELQAAGLNWNSAKDRYDFIKNNKKYSEWNEVPHYWLEDSKGIIYDPTGYIQFIKTGLAKDLNPSRYKKERINEISGYIPSKKEANDPRFKTALTVDVKPDTLQKNAKAFGFKVSRAGIPPLLRK